MTPETTGPEASEQVFNYGDWIQLGQLTSEVEMDRSMLIHFPDGMFVEAYLYVDENLPKYMMEEFDVDFLPDYANAAESLKEAITNNLPVDLMTSFISDEPLEGLANFGASELEEYRLELRLPNGEIFAGTKFDWAESARYEGKYATWNVDWKRVGGVGDSYDVLGFPRDTELLRQLEIRISKSK